MIGLLARAGSGLALVVLFALGVWLAGLRALPRGAWLAWHSNRSGNYEIYLWDGRVTVNVSRHPEDDLWAAWSPDGRLAWHARTGGSYEVYVWDWQRVTNVSADPRGNDALPTWSADGRLAWNSDAAGDDEIVVWDGSTARNVSLDPQADDRNAVWASDGRLAWRSGRDGETEIVVWDGATTRNVSASVGSDTWAAWSERCAARPGCTELLAWTSERRGDDEIVIWDGTTTRNISAYTAAPDTHPAWSVCAAAAADCTPRLAWTSYRERDFDGEIYIWAGDKPVNFTDYPVALDHSAAWSTHDWLAWTSDRDGNQEVYAAPAHPGASVQALNVSAHPAADDGAVWSR